MQITIRPLDIVSRAIAVFLVGPPLARKGLTSAGELREELDSQRARQGLVQLLPPPTLLVAKRT